MSLQIFEKTQRAMIEGLEFFVASPSLWLLGHRFSLAPQIQDLESSSETRDF